MKILKCDLCHREERTKADGADKQDVQTIPAGGAISTGRLRVYCDWRLSVGGGSQDLEICGVCKGRLTQALESCLSEMKGTDEAGEVAS